MMIFDKLVTYSGVISRMVLLACFRSGRFSRVSESRGKMKEDKLANCFDR
jgi:hypothetical protein